MNIHVNKFGEFDEGCVCGGGDFYPCIRDHDSHYIEVEPVVSVSYDGYACINCKRVFNDEGEMIAHPETVSFLDE